jgi:hypothetical protein
MPPRTLLPRQPKGLSFDIADHVIASQWAVSNRLRLSVDLNYSVEGEEYEEVLALSVESPDRRLWCVIWQQSDCVMVQPMLGRPSQHACLIDALSALAPAALRVGRRVA